MCSVISFDVGIVNLAYCKINYSEFYREVTDWKVINITEPEKGKRKYVFENLCPVLYKALGQLPEADHYVIEKQPGPKNILMKQIETAIFCFFIEKIGI